MLPHPWIGRFLVASTVLSPTLGHAAQLGERPAYVLGTPSVTAYDGRSNDLLTAGLGTAGLGSATAPGYADPLNPTAEELRRATIYNNYRAIVDPTPGGGYGTFYGPNVTAEGVVTSGPGMVAGTEYVLLTKVSSRNSNVVSSVSVVVQIPTTYNPAQGCIVAAPSSGSRGPYGAIATAGEWGLKRGCAVAYTDKGTGVGAHDLHNNIVNLVRGERADAVAAGSASTFTARLSEAQRIAFDTRLPNRFAFKHAHGQANPEADWGLYVLQSIEVAFWVLNQHFAPTAAGPYPITRSNTIVIGSSVSNGGGASLRAAEQDTAGLMDGVAVAEPNVQPVFSPAFAIRQGAGPLLTQHSRSLIDYITLKNVYAGCAAAQPSLAGAPLNLASSAGRCQSLAAAGLLASGTVTAQAAEAQAIINAAGILPEQNFVSPSYWFASVFQSVSMTYANAYGRFGVADNLCGYSFGATASGLPVPLAPGSAAALYANANGIPPSAGVNLINDLGPNSPAEDRVSTPDQNLRGALCLRALATGRDPVTNAALSGPEAAQAARILAGLGPVRATGQLRIPAIWVTGRNDALLPPNFTSRPYFGLTQTLGGNTRYYEVTNAQHLDTFNQFAGFNSTLVPLHVYFLRAMDLMLAHIRTGAPLAPSQVIRTTPRGPGAPPLIASHLPPISGTPSAADLLTLGSGVLAIPD